ncbi:GSCFA domain-containing protein [Pseudoalteromonas xiamenensis]|uniref:GSCFA domain-containing protein n=1 Tax=Pseudoalteromonas xiamenensis TaxID=882626 RepID=A0A975HKI2_9GAMM|nr:GSCFA domain-containing protein [Pseudoalteromonas xiamenensis]QTH71048.1 GSCFA domain-containing protein [Pseudoalteromonas xiamenensis]
MQNLLLGNIPSQNRLILDLPNYELINSVDKKFVTFGSCFASSVSRGLWRLGFDTHFSEDMGFHYSPNSIAQFLKQIDLQPQELHDYVIELDDGRFKSVATRYLSGRNQTKEQFCEFLHEENQKLKRKLVNADYVVITFGNAIYQRVKDSGLTLCHGGGLPNALYDVIKSPYEEVLEHVQDCLKQIRLINEQCAVILTVSPQRYGWLMNANLSTGINEILDLDKGSATNWLINSNLDKAKLRLAVDAVIESNSIEQLYYFPSYEIVMDELRDYEGFNHDVKDLMHVNMPNTPNYVINKFLNSFCSQQVKDAFEFYRSILDILIDGYPARLRKMSETRAKQYIEEKLPFVSNYIDTVKAEKLAGYVLNAMLQVFPDITKSTIELNGHTNLISFLHLDIENKKAAVQNIGQESIAILGYSTNFDILCRDTNLLSKNIKCVIDPALAVTSIYGLPVLNNLSQCEINEDIIFVLNQELLNHPMLKSKLANKVIL